MAKPFKEWKMNEVTGALADLAKKPGMKANLDFYRGDHWQNSAGWVGPIPDPTTTDLEDVGRYMTMLQRVFTSANVVREVTDRHVNAVFGKGPKWTFTPKRGLKPGQKPTDEETTVITEIEAALTAWMDKRDAAKVLKKAAAGLKVTGQGCVRLFIPPGLIEGGRVTAPTVADALDLIYLEAVDHDQGGKVLDRKMMREAVYFKWNEDGKEYAEFQYVDFDAEGKPTIVRSFGPEFTNGSEDYPLPLGGRLLMYVFEDEPMITEQVRQQQKGLNFAVTAMGKNNEHGGFLQMIVLNAQPPGEYRADPERPNRQKFFPSSFTASPGVTPFLQGTTVTDKETNATTIATPSIYTRQPSPVTTFTDSEEAYRTNIYREVHQGHLVVSGDGSASGESRIQLRADYETSLEGTKPHLEGALRWLLETLVAIVAMMTAEAKKYEEYRAVAVFDPYAGPISEDERRAIIEMINGRIISRETGQGRLGIDDPDAEAARIAAEVGLSPITMAELIALAPDLEAEQWNDIFRRAGIKEVDVTVLKARIEAERSQRAQASADRGRLINPQEDPAPSTNDDE